MRIPSSEASQFSKTWTLDCDTGTEKSKSSADVKKKPLIICLEESPPLCDHKSKRVSMGSLSYIMDKYFALPKHVTRQVTQYSSLCHRDDVWIRMVDSNRETNV